ncbi:Glutamate receptor 2.9 [Vitis vinifera]|uniref:Glutamate receptor 2.9 n=1 Tax=Vitis vinifera TaxID=29760 RepID=A0A438H4C1_VITVI|nr:Glutamate receptor 2.9 [Vitis vinifera]
MFENEYPEEDNTKPGIHALRAYDSISVIANALCKISFQGGDQLDSNSLPLRIINLVGKGYKELDFWTQDLDHPFSREGYLKRVPKGWEMPTDEKRLKIGIPANTSFDKFVKVDEAQIDPEKKYTGFCIDIFREVIKILEQNYSLPYDFHPYDGTYDELVDRVYTKTYDAVVGDMTILANRSRIVEFTQPFAESGLSMITPVKSREAYKAWLFMKPFTMEMWVVTGVILIYTMFIVWILEHQNNPEFQGSWKDQLGTTLLVHLLFSFLCSHYTASLSSMLTVQRLEPNVTDIEWLKVHKLNVGCDGDSFVRKYLEDVLDFKKDNIKNISSQYAYPNEFQKGTISAAFLELPYEKVFMNRYCKKYTASNPLSRFGGLGFVFQKGSPIAADVSKAILTLSERGILQSLEDKWFPSSDKCSTTDTTELSLQNFWALYVLCGATSTICFLLFLCRLLLKYFQQNAPSESAWRRTVELANYIHNVEIKIPDRASDFSQGSNRASSSGSPGWVLVSPSDAPEPSEASPPTAIQMI